MILQASQSYLHRAKIVFGYDCCQASEDETLKVNRTVIGAGLGGLAFAQNLRRASAPFRVFERDRSIDTRNQGYRIRPISECVAAFRSLVTDDIWQLFEETSPRISLGGLPTIDAVSCHVT